MSLSQTHFRQLPIWRHRRSILRHLQHHQIIVLESPTGSGKTTQMPIILYHAGYAERGMIGITQPRRIAAVSVSQFIAHRMKGDDSTVAYKMRFEDTTTKSTRIKVMTDGILLQEMKLNPLLEGYSVIIIDEAHERSLNIDFSLGLLKQMLTHRDDIRIIISSAMLNTKIFSRYFDNCPIVSISTPSYPVEITYRPPSVGNDPEQLIDTIVAIVGRALQQSVRGDILIFLPGERLIKDCLLRLKRQSYSKRLHLLPLYGRMSKEEQEQVFPPGPRKKTKVVVATNIAETSITIDGIVTVIDSGLAKINHYHTANYTSSLVETPISQSSAVQRCGRAGRTRPGHCWRLYSRQGFESRALYTQEEIYRTDLSEVVLRMAELGIRDYARFDFISSPERRAFTSAVETLRTLQALNRDNSLSTIGQTMARFPLLPRHSRMIVEAMNRYPEVLQETITSAAFLTSNTPFLLPTGEEDAARQAQLRYRDPRGDFLAYLKILKAYEAARDRPGFCLRHYLDPVVMASISNVKYQLIDIVEEMNCPVGEGGAVSELLCAVATGLIQFVCVRNGRGSYCTLTAQRIRIHPGSVLFNSQPRFIVAGEIVRTSGTYARSVSVMERAWLEQVSPELARQLITIAERQQQRKSGRHRRNPGKRHSSGKRATGT